MATPYRSQVPQAQHFLQTPRSVRSNYSPYPFSAGQPGPSTSFTDGGSSNVGRSVSNVFINNPHGHPSFNPAKIGGKGSMDSKIPKQPKAPEKPLMPYMRYSRKVWDSVKASNPDLKLWEIGKIIGQMWRELSDEEKQEYLDEYDAEKVQYTEAMKAYHNSPAYQTWLSAKGKTDQDVEQEEPEKTRRSGKGISSTHQSDQRSIMMQPCEDDDEAEDNFSIKHVAAARFQRNHCLINEVFSDSVVPDVRSIINETRMTVLKRQVHSLTMHQKKLENELEEIEQDHKNKKAKFSDSSEKFYEDLAKLCEARPQITEDQFNEMVVKAKTELLEKQKVMQQQQQIEMKKAEEEAAAAAATAAAAAKETAAKEAAEAASEPMSNMNEKDSDVQNDNNSVITNGVIEKNKESSAEPKEDVDESSNLTEPVTDNIENNITDNIDNDLTDNAAINDLTDNATKVTDNEDKKIDPTTTTTTDNEASVEPAKVEQMEVDGNNEVEPTVVSKNKEQELSCENGEQELPCENKDQEQACKNKEQELPDSATNGDKICDKKKEVQDSELVTAAADAATDERNDSNQLPSTQH